MIFPVPVALICLQILNKLKFVLAPYLYVLLMMILMFIAMYYVFFNHESDND